MRTSSTERTNVLAKASRCNPLVRSCVLLAAVVTTATIAGPLTPPAGPVAPTLKTLTEVEPRTAINATNTPGDSDASPSLFKISQPGSYYLTGNITGVAGRHGIEIASSGVTLDLNGFDLVGVPTMGTFDGVTITVPNLTNLAVVNGSVRNWGRDGINLGIPTSSGSRIERLNVSGNARSGIFTGSRSVVSNCTASGGLFGIFVALGSTVVDCSASNTITYGIAAGPGSTISNSAAYDNTGIGIFADSGCVVVNCSSYLNAGTGIFGVNGVSVSNCAAYSNGGAGISTSSGATILNCTVRLNSLDGIRVSENSRVVGNTCDSNGSGSGDGAGILVTGADNRIEGNNCTDNDRGIDVDSAGNIIIKNTCSGNTIDWDIAANNIYGPIIDRRLSPPTTTTPAVSGAAATGTMGSTDPNANLTY